MPPTIYIYTFLYITLESVNYLQIVFFSFRIFGKTMFIEIIGLQEWIYREPVSYYPIKHLKIHINCHFFLIQSYNETSDRNTQFNQPQ
jgi:hypothetical protein